MYSGCVTSDKDSRYNDFCQRSCPFVDCETETSDLGRQIRLTPCTEHRAPVPRVQNWALPGIPGWCWERVLAPETTDRALTALTKRRIMLQVSKPCLTALERGTRAGRRAPPFIIILSQSRSLLRRVSVVQGPVSDVRGHSLSKTHPIPKFPDQPRIETSASRCET